MTEAFLHYLWKNRLFEALYLPTGEQLGVVSLGEHNDGAGPDFKFAKIKSGNFIWVGDLEMHLHSSEWHRHKHSEDPNYNQVILHVVLIDDATSPITDTNGRVIPTAVLSVSPLILRRLALLQPSTISSRSIRCVPELNNLSKNLFWTSLAPLIEERIAQKVANITATPDASMTVVNNDFFYYTLLRYLGAHKNHKAMELTARSLPLAFVRKHASSLSDLEAMLLGQASLLRMEKPRDDYEQLLVSRYVFFKQKFSLTPIPENTFCKLRIRPSAYPAKRLALAAQLLTQEERLLSFMIEADFRGLRQYLTQLSPAPYWQSHYDFDSESPKTLTALGSSSINTLLINVFIPTAYLYHRSLSNHSKANEILSTLQNLPTEKNQYTQLFAKHNHPPTNAMQSQTLLQLYQNYCLPHNCIICPLSSLILQELKDTVTEPPDTPFSCSTDEPFRGFDLLPKEL